MANELGLSDDAALFLIEFGEDILYRASEGGTERTVRAIIDRNPPEALAEPPNKALAPLLAVEVMNSADEVTLAGNTFKGISTSEVDTGGGEVKLALRIGETAQWRPIKKLLSQDPGILRLGVR